MHIPPVMLSDADLPFESFLMKQFTNDVLTKQESYFNYRLRDGSVVAEGAYGQLKEDGGCCFAFVSLGETQMKHNFQHWPAWFYITFV